MKNKPPQTHDPHTAAFHNSIHDQKPKSGMFGKMWATYVLSDNHSLQIVQDWAFKICDADYDAVAATLKDSQLPWLRRTPRRNETVVSEAPGIGWT
jgi:hypothetical protein